jgi:hypothetical protein
VGRCRRSTWRMRCWINVPRGNTLRAVILLHRSVIVC